MRKLIFTILIAAGCLQAAAERTVPFFDTSRPDKVIALGLRAGMNSSGVATNYMDKQPELIQSNFYWHSGVQVGAIADLNIRKFLAIEVGLFWERHGYDAAMMAATAEEDYMGSQSRACATTISTYRCLCRGVSTFCHRLYGRST